MKFNFKKITSVIASGVMLMSTAGMALAANYPAPFVEDGSADSAIVVTSGSHSTAAVDMAAATSLQEALNGQVSTTEAVTEVSGDNVLIDAIGDSLSYGQPLSSVDEKLTDSDLAVLSDGTLTDDSEDEDYEYEQELYTTDDSVTYDTLDEDDYVVNTDASSSELPVLYIDQSSGAAYALVVEFDSSVNASALDDSEKITIAGKEMTFDPDMSTGDDELVFFASEETVTVGVGETVSIGSDSVTVVGANTDSDEATISINGEQYQVEKGDKEEGYYVNDIFMQTIPEDNAQVELFAGSEKVVIEEDGSNEVEVDGEDLDGVYAEINSVSEKEDDVDAIDDIVFAFMPSELDSDAAQYLEAGEELVDPLFGSFKMVFTGASPALDDSEKSSIELSGENSEDLEITFTNRDEDEYTITPFTGNGTNVTWQEDFFDVSSDLDGIVDDNIFIVSEASGSSEITRVYQVTKIEDSDYPDGDDYVEFEDLSTGETKTVNAGEELGSTGLYVANSTNGTNLSSDEFYLLDSGGSSVSAQDYVITDTGVEITLALNTGANNNGTVTMAEDSDDDIIDDEDITAETIKTVITTDSDDDIKIGSPSATVGSIYGGTGDDDISYQITELGSYIEYDVEDDSYLDILTPEEETEYSVYFAETDAVTVTDGGTSGPVMVVTDDEVSSVSDNNLVVIGGSCINSVAAEILGVEAGTCGSDFTDSTDVGAGQYLVKAVESPYNADKVAVLAAGYAAAETQNAVDKLMEGHSTDVDTEEIYPVQSA